jgi:hypothetical protein
MEEKKREGDGEKKTEGEGEEGNFSSLRSNQRY